MVNIKLTALIWFGLFLMSGYTAWFFKHFHLGLNGEMKSTITDKKKKKAILYDNLREKLTAKK